MVNKLIHKINLKKWATLIVLSLALMIIIIDTTVLNVSIRNIIDDLGTTVQSIQWVISAYALTLAAFTITGGRLGDLFGRKRLFVIGAILFAVGSFITSIAPNIAWVIIGDSIIEGLGAALMMPATASLIVSTYHGRDRAIGFAVWGGVAAAGTALGPILGGYLTANYSWRWAFRINLIVVLFLLLGSKFIAESKEKLENSKLDYIGIVLSSLGLVSLVYGFIESSTYGWLIAKTSFKIFEHVVIPQNISVTPFAIVLGIVLLWGFLAWEKRYEASGKTPLVSLSLLRNKQFAVGTSVNALLALGQTGLVFALPIFYQSVRGLDAFRTGLGLLPMSIGIMFGAPLSLKFNQRFTPKRVTQVGLIFMILGMLYLALTINPQATVWSLSLGMILYGFGAGFTMSQLSNLTLSAVSAEQSGESSGVNSTLRQVGASFGSAIIGAALISSMSSSIVSGVNQSPAVPPQVKPILVEQIKQAGSNIEFSTPHEDSKLPKPIAQEITNIMHQGTVDGNKIALLIAGGFSMLALGLSSWLPNIHDVDRSKKKQPKAKSRPRQ